MTHKSAKAHLLRLFLLVLLHFLLLRHLLLCPCAFCCLLMSYNAFCSLFLFENGAISVLFVYSPHVSQQYFAVVALLFVCCCFFVLFFFALDKVE